MAASSLPPCDFAAVYHWPKIYRYRVADPGWRGTWNRYSGQRGSVVIGLAVAAGRYAYCIKWATAKVIR